jgi:zinc protease
MLLIHDFWKQLLSGKKIKMINYKKFELSNGLRVIVHTDNTSPMVAVNILYDVGAKDEDEQRTGFAHLFEHLMFGGSINIEEYDEPLQSAGGENNAYTTNDLTNYYIQLPKKNLETALWLESDRMLSLAFSEKSLDVQRKVVCEEFKEHYLNKPYGDVWHHLRTLTYKVHPYKWMTIGKELSHIETAQLQDVKDFFNKHYNPSNAILCLAGDIEETEAQQLCEKWFGSIPAGNKYTRSLPTEPKQAEARTLTVNAKVPVSALYKAYHIPGRMELGYHECDLITDILSGGKSSRLYQALVKEQQLCSSIGCYHLGTVEPGLIIIDAKIADGIDIKTANEAIDNVLQHFLKEGVADIELHKVKNKTESIIAFEDLSLTSRANNLAFYELLGDTELINTELDKYNAVTLDSLMQQAHKIFTSENSNTLFYLAEN